MNAVLKAAQRLDDPVSERIYTTIAGRGMKITTVAILADIRDTTWRLHARTGDWRTKELQRIAKVLGVSFEWLVAALNEEAA